MRAASLLMAGLTLGATLGVTGRNSTPTLTGTSDFTSDPEGARIGILLAGAPVRVLETRGEWA
ncbi:MAG TPA: hypothetical protein VFP98_00995, partial [Candidatus Polarisedimenticolia bacterium]|nr:hypothetical protein [Candidatus Polarisedimenticolia bacterium]